MTTIHGSASSKEFGVVGNPKIPRGSADASRSFLYINTKRKRQLLSILFWTVVFLSKTKLFGGEVIISSVGDVGSVFRCPKFNRPMTLGNNMIMLKSDFNNYFYLLFNSDHGQGLLYGITSGSVQEKFNKTAFRELEIQYPSIDKLFEFEKIVENYFSKIDSNKNQIQSLTSLRDALLPKLMSGEVRVNF